MIKVEFINATRFHGKFRQVGDKIEVSNEEATRLANNEIAKLLSNGEDDQVEEAEDAYESMSAKDLYALCVEKGLDVKPKQSRASYIEALEGAE